MTKVDFLAALKNGLSCLPQEDIVERLNFYSEMIDDRIGDGLSEENAVKETGDVNEIITQIIADVPLSKLIKQKIKPKRLKNNPKKKLLKKIIWNVFLKDRINMSIRWGKTE